MWGIMQDEVQCDTREGIYQQPSSAFVAEGIGQASTIHGIINNVVIETEIGTFPHQLNFHSDSRVRVMIRPNEIQFAPSENEFRTHSKSAISWLADPLRSWLGLWPPYSLLHVADSRV